MAPRKTLDEKLDVALKEGFPASDPPTVFGDTSDEKSDDMDDEADGKKAREAKP